MLGLATRNEVFVSAQNVLVLSLSCSDYFSLMQCIKIKSKRCFSRGGFLHVLKQYSVAVGHESFK